MVQFLIITSENGDVTRSQPRSQPEPDFNRQAIFPTRDIRRFFQDGSRVNILLFNEVNSHAAAAEVAASLLFRLPAYLPHGNPLASCPSRS